MLILKICKSSCVVTKDTMYILCILQRCVYIKNILYEIIILIIGWTDLKY